MASFIAEKKTFVRPVIQSNGDEGKRNALSYNKICSQITVKNKILKGVLA